MAKRKSASKQAVEGISRPPKPQSANTGNRKPPTSSNQPSATSSKPQNRTALGPPQPQVTANNRSSNGTKFQGIGNGSPKYQGANGLTRIFGVEATPGHKASQDRSMHQITPKRGNGLKNDPRKAQGHVPVPRSNVSLKFQPPTPKSVPRDHTQKAQNQAPKLQMSRNHQQPTNSGKSSTDYSPKIQASTQNAPRRGKTVQGHKDNPPKSTKSDRFLGPANTPLLNKNVPSPPPAKSSLPISSAGSKRSYANQVNMPAIQSPAVEGSGLLGWFSSWLPSAGLAPVQATKKPMPNPNKGLLNGSRTHQIESPNPSTSAKIGESNNKGTFRTPNKPRKSYGATRGHLAAFRQVSKSSKGDVNLSKSHPVSSSYSTSSGPKHSKISSKGVPLLMGSINNGPYDMRDRLGKSNTSASGTGPSRMRSYATLPKEHTPDRYEATRSDAELLRVVSTHRTQKSSKHQSVQGLSTVKYAKYTSVPRKKEFRVRSSKVLSQARKETLRNGLLHRYSPTLIWRSSDRPKVVSAYSTLAASPLPSLPKTELQNKAARKTIAQNPDLFKIITPIKVDAFEKNLKDHPNQPFVVSVVNALRNGFWPWANTSGPALPTTYDGSHQRKPITSKDKVHFIQQQRNEEVALERWSKPFGKNLLPGMHSSPIGAVPKASGKYRLIIDQSSGPHALNSRIPKSQVKVKLDSIHDLGTALLAVRKKHPKRKLTLFKSDVKSAYRQLPMHPSWQIKQVISIDGQRYVDRCNTFGNRGGGWSWNAFASLVNWIGTEKKNISDLLGYVDDNFGWEFEGNTKYYKPYKKHLPAKQTRLLKLWDELGVPHDEENNSLALVYPSSVMRLTRMR